MNMTVTVLRTSATCAGAVASVRALPQFEQKRASSALSRPHRGQVITARVYRWPTAASEFAGALMRAGRKGQITTRHPGQSIQLPFSRQALQFVNPVVRELDIRSIEHIANG